MRAKNVIGCPPDRPGYVFFVCGNHGPDESCKAIVYRWIDAARGPSANGWALCNRHRGEVNRPKEPSAVNYALTLGAEDLYKIVET